MQHDPRPAFKPKRRKASADPKDIRALAVVLLLAIVGIGGGIAIGSFSCSSDGPQADGSPTDAAQPQETRVSFAAVGDNLPNEVLGAYADALAGDIGDGVYDYTPIYQNIKPYIESADLAFISQETHLGGDELGPRGWPSFNTPSSMADAIVSTGFDLVALASNHAYDWGNYGASEYSSAVWENQPVASTGTAASAEEAAAIAVVERNGITFSLLSYTYGVNGFSQSDLAPYAVNFIDEERIRTDVARAKEQSDVVLVAMHWGTENQFEPDEDQLYYAQLLADLEVDVVLGSHPHVIGPLEWVEGASGHRTLVAYSLGNFLSNHNAPGPANELEGMLTCDFVKNDGAVSIENIVWTPLVNHNESGAYSLYALKDYTPDLAARNTTLSGLDDPIAWMRETSEQVVTAFPVNA